MGYPIRLSADLRMCAPPRRFSQLTAAFFAGIRLGIHRKPYSRLTILLFLQPLSTPQFQDVESFPHSVRTFADPILSNIYVSTILTANTGGVGRERVELSTPALSEQCSNRLSYRPSNSTALSGVNSQNTTGPGASKSSCYL